MNKLKKAIYSIPLVQMIYSIRLNRHYKALYEKSPKLAAEEFYSSIHKGKKLNLENPQTLEEKNIWLALNTDTTMWSILSDKYAVRDYVRRCGLSNTLNDLYGKWDNVEDIDFSALPKEFVIKANNSCATVIIVRDKEKLDVKETKKTIKKWFTGIPYGYVGYNGHYLRIKPCIIAEKLLHDSKSDGLPIDYKFFCSYGKVFVCEVMQGRTEGTHSIRATFYDENWNILYDNNKVNRGKLIDKPVSYDLMVQYCYQLAKDFPLVRVDFYEIGGQPIFGEMTFTTGVSVFSDEINLELGKHIELPERINQNDK